MSLFVVDVEADGPCPGLYSMVSFGAIKMQMDLEKAPTFYSDVLRPISNDWIPEALAVSGWSRKGMEAGEDVMGRMEEFNQWVLDNSSGGPIFISDNPAFDWQFINYYFHAFTQSGNPFGFSARRIGDFSAGISEDWSAQSSWKKLRKTKHSHDPVDDARGNAEALLEIMTLRFGKSRAEEWLT